MNCSIDFRTTLPSYFESIEADGRYDIKITSKAVKLINNNNTLSDISLPLTTKADGAIALLLLQVYGDQEMHDAARRLAMDYILQNADYFSQYITEEIET